VKYRNIEKEDLESCANIYSEVFSAEPWSESWNKQMALERLHFYDSKGFVGVIAESDKKIGFVLGNIEPFYYGSIFYLREMCVVVSMQSKGLGSKLLLALESDLKKRSVKSIYLATERNISASHFYLKNSFSVSEETSFYEKKIT